MKQFVCNIFDDDFSSIIIEAENQEEAIKSVKSQYLGLKFEIYEIDRIIEV